MYKNHNNECKESHAHINTDALTHTRTNTVNGEIQTYDAIRKTGELDKKKQQKNLKIT